MAGHSHWAGIKHKKGRADKERSKIFSKLSKEITVAAKLGSKDPGMNPRLRSAIQTARAANMPKDNIERALKKSEINKSLNYNSLTYEGFGPEKIAIIIEALTDNKNRTASNIRTIFQKFGGNLGESGAASHQFKQSGVIRIDKKKIQEFISSGIEWLPINKVSLDKEKSKSVVNFLEALENEDDVQHVYANLEMDSNFLDKILT